MKDKLIAIVDDDADIVSLVTEFLDAKGVRSKGFPGGEKLFDFLKKEKPDLIILDLMLGGMDGFEICKKLKSDERYADVPVVMLTGKGDVSNKISGLDLGADDYLVKPFSLDELLARIKAVLRRGDPVGEDKKIRVGDIIEMDLKRFKVLVYGKEVELTAAEFKILEVLAKRKGQVFSRDRILDYLWGKEKIVVERTVDVHIRHLREKLGKAGKIIKSIRGVGYKLDEE